MFVGNRRNSCSGEYVTTCMHMNVELITFFCKFFYSTNDSVLERMKKENNLKEGGEGTVRI
jgi:hypothetical protein